MVDGDECYALSFLVVLAAGKGRIRRILLHPVRVVQLRVRLVNGKERQFLARTMQAKCASCETSRLFHAEIGTMMVG